MTSIVTAAAVSKNFGAYQDAAVREPVIITKNDGGKIGLGQGLCRHRHAAPDAGTALDDLLGQHIGRTGAGHGPDRTRLTQALRQLAVTDRVPRRNLPQGRPHRLLKRRAAHVQG